MDNKDIKRLIGLLEQMVEIEKASEEPCPISKAVSMYLAAKEDVLSPRTIQDYTLTLTRFLEFVGKDKLISEIAPSLVKEFITTIPGGKKNKQNAHIALSALWTWAINESCVSDHVIRRVEIAKPETRAIIPFSKEEVERMLRSAKYSGRDHKRNVAIIMLLLDTGIRATELCGLLLTDLEGDFIRVLGKGSKERRVPVSPVAMATVMDYLETTPAKKRNSPVFYSETGIQLDRFTLRKMIYRLGERAKVRNAHPHKFRHTFAVNYLLNGGDPYTLQMILGHSTMDMVRRYLYLTNKDVAAVHLRASPLANWKLASV